MTSISNRRDALRLATGQPVQVGNTPATMVNVSLTGARLVLESATDELFVSFSLEGRLFELPAEVVWRRSCGRSVVVGVKFGTLTDDEVKKLRGHVLCNYYRLHAA